MTSIGTEAVDVTKKGSLTPQEESPSSHSLRFPSSQTFSGIKRSIFSSFSSAAASAAATVKASAQKLGSTENELSQEYSQPLKELGLSGDSNVIRDDILKCFVEIAGSKPDASITLERFVIDMCMRGQNALWADAAFRAVDNLKRGQLNKYEYLFAVLSLQPDDCLLDNEKWLELRRQTIFEYYDRGQKGFVSRDNFYEFMKDASSASEDPEMYGISNKEWCIPAAKAPSPQSGMDEFALSQALAISKVDLAQKQHDLEEMQLAYIKLEKKLCALKLEMAAVKSLVDR